MEVRRESALSAPTRQTNVSFSRRGVIRGLHYHERGQNDLFACLDGMARVVVLDRMSGETFTVDIGDDNPVAVWIPGRHAHGFEALTDLLFCYHVTEEYDAADPDEHEIPWDDPRVKHLWSTQSPILSSRDKAAAAWTDVDGAEDDPQDAAAVNVGGTKHAAELGPLVYYSSDYVFDGNRQTPYVESDAPNPQSAYGRSKAYGEAAAGEEAWIVRSSWLFGPTGHNFVRTMLRLGAERDEGSVGDDLVGGPTYVGHLAEATRADGECTWAEFAQAIFEEAKLECRVTPISTAELRRPARRPAYSVLRSEKPEAPRLPHWREGLRECLARLAARSPGGLPRRAAGGP